MKPPRIPLLAFPDIVLHADELAVKRHPQYAAAKAGDTDAAENPGEQPCKPKSPDRIDPVATGSRCSTLACACFGVRGG